MNRGTRLYAVLFLVMASLKFLLISPLKIIAFNTPHDELRLVQMTFDLIATSPPHYSHMNSIRQLGYPFWLAACYKLHIPIRLAQEGIYQVAGFILGLSLLQTPRTRMAAYLFIVLYLWAPYSFISNRMIVAENLATALLVSIVAGWLSSLSENPSRRPRGWLEFSLALAMGWFWHIRPDSVWILPAFLLWIVMIMHHRNISALVRLLIWPVMAIMTGSLFFSMWNFTHYGFFATYDLKQHQFQRAYRQLSRIRSEGRLHDIPIPKDIRTKLYASSSAFRELKPYFDGPGRGWFVFSCEKLNICDDYAVGWFFWALRDAVAKAGYYQTPIKAERFYARLADDVDQSCRAQTLDCSSFVNVIPARGDVDVLLLEHRWLGVLPGMRFIIRRLDNALVTCDLRWGDSDQHTRDPFERLDRDIGSRTKSPLRQYIDDLRQESIVVIRTIYIPIAACGVIMMIVGVPILFLQQKDPQLKAQTAVITVLLASRILLLSIMTVAGSSPILIADRYLWPAAPPFMMLMSLSAIPVIAVLRRRSGKQKTNLWSGIRQELS